MKKTFKIAALLVMALIVLSMLASCADFFGGGKSTTGTDVTTGEADTTKVDSTSTDDEDSKIGDTTTGDGTSDDHGEETSDTPASSEDTPVSTDDKEVTTEEETTKPSVPEIKVTFEDALFIYDGEPKSISIDGALPEGVSVSYEGNECIDIGEHTVSAKFTSTNPDYQDIDDLTAVIKIVGGVYINEVCSDNASVLKDSYGNFSDYIEIYNPNNTEINLKGYSLSDNGEKLDKFVITGDVKIPAKSFLVVFASEADSKSNEVHASFKISSGGETVYVSYGDMLIDSLAVPMLEENKVMGRETDGSVKLCYMDPTPKASNNSATNKTEYVKVEAPKFSSPSGFYTSEVAVRIMVPDGCTVYYTLDGSIPTENSKEYSLGKSLVFTDASVNDNILCVRKDLSTASYGSGKVKDKANILRAVAIDSNGNRSNVVSSTYFVDFENKVGYDDMVIISFVTDPSNLFDYNKGIFVKGYYFDQAEKSGENSGKASYYKTANWTQRGSEWEREAHIDFFESDDDHSYIFSQEVGIRVKGETARHSAQKSLNVYARTRYDGNSEIQYNIFDPDTDLSGFVIRNGGNDITETKIRDSLLQSLVLDRSFGAQMSRPCVAFIDGEFWGFYTLTEKIDESYIKNHYGVDEDNSMIFKCNSLEHGTDADKKLFNELMAFKKVDLSIDSNYNDLLEIIDIQSYIDYCCAEIYFANFDWPIHNEALWRSRTVNPDNEYEDGKWRWLMYDLDYAAGLYGQSQTVASYDTFTGKIGNDELFKSFCKSKRFVEQFVTTFMDMVNKNFNMNVVNPRIDEYISVYSVPMQQYSLQFFYGNINATQFASKVNNIRSFFQQRSSNITKHMKNFFKLSSSLTEITVSESIAGAGEIRLNSIDLPLNSSGSWKGSYYTEYALKVTATAKPGYIFKGWEVGSGIEATSSTSGTTLTFKIKSSGTRTVKAIFEEDTDYKTRKVLAEFAYKDGTASTDLENGSKTDGYAPTSGVVSDKARLYASLNGEAGRKLEWSGKLYDGKTAPVMTASSSKPWEEGANFEIAVSTKGYRNIVLSAELGGTNSGARDFRLQYSLDGEKYTDIADSAVTLEENKTMIKAYSNFALPEAVANRDVVYIRIAVASGYTIGGEETLFGSTGGGNAINNISIYGNAVN